MGELSQFRSHPLSWIVEPLREQPSYIEKQMFGSRARYLHGRLMLLLTAQEKPWDGVLIPTERGFHQALCASFPELTSHPVLGKWLYIPEDHDSFEAVCRKVVALIARDDPRIGVYSVPKKRRKGKKKGKR